MCSKESRLFWAINRSLYLKGNEFNMKPHLTLCLIVGLITGLVMPAHTQQAEFPDLEKQIQQDYPYLEALYQYLHEHPELSFYETETASRMAQELRSIGLEVTEGVGGTGVVGILKNGEGPTILIRADMDALPIVEETGLPFASTVTTQNEEGTEVGVMHACGHDMHMTAWVGAARAMAALRDQWAGTLVFIGQPAEERGGGAKAMLADGLYERFPTPDYGLALHVTPEVAAGSVGICQGYSMANVDMVDITVFGEGGHGAAPHQTIDPVVLSAELILNLQTIVSRELNPTDPAVLTVGAIHGGSKGNVIPNQVDLQLTLRSYSDDVRETLIRRIRERAQALAQGAGLPPEKYPVVTVRDEYTPALYNDPDFTQTVRASFLAALGEDRVVTVGPKMVGEDFGRFGRTSEAVPILQYWLGAAPPEEIAAGTPLPSLHSSRFVPVTQPTLETGVLTLSAALLSLLKK
jgi:amidohydrolase